MEQEIDYSRRLEQAGLQVVRGVLAEVAVDGIPGEHHFYLTFDPGEPGVELSDSLRDAYPEEMTIVLQHQYDDLAVDEQQFSVVLSFGGVPERIVVPWGALRRFVDPAARFGLQFTGDTGGTEGSDEAEPPRGPRGVISEPDRPEEPDCSTDDIARGVASSANEESTSDEEAEEVTADVLRFDDFRRS